jgi:hypothetical protein
MSNAAPWAATAGNRFREVARTTENAADLSNHGLLTGGSPGRKGGEVSEEAMRLVREWYGKLHDR